MNLTLTRTDYLASGIFGYLEPEDNSFELFTLERAYPYTPDGTVSAVMYQSKIPVGVYTCKRGLHRLYTMTSPFETFEITGISGHTNLLFHLGNTENDSEGCVLLGLSRNGNTILQSHAAFNIFIKAHDGVDSFKLTVL